MEQLLLQMEIIVAKNEAVGPLYTRVILRLETIAGAILAVKNNEIFFGNFISLTYCHEAKLK